MIGRRLIGKCHGGGTTTGSRVAEPGALPTHSACFVVPVTAAVLTVLARLGDDLGKDATQRALAWMLARPAPLTGSVLLGLASAGHGAAPAAERAARYLLERQRADGAWPNDECVATLVPPDLFYEYGGAPR